MIVGRSIPCHPVGDNQADCSGMVAQQIAQSCNGGTFHFVIRHFVILVTECCNPVVDTGHRQWQA